MLEVKNISRQEKIVLQLTFNPRLTLTGFRTTQPRGQVYQQNPLEEWNHRALPWGDPVTKRWQNLTKV